MNLLHVCGMYLAINCQIFLFCICLHNESPLSTNRVINNCTNVIKSVVFVALAQEQISLNVYWEKEKKQGRKKRNVSDGPVAIGGETVFQR